MLFKMAYLTHWHITNAVELSYKAYIYSDLWIKLLKKNNKHGVTKHISIVSLNKGQQNDYPKWLSCHVFLYRKCYWILIYISKIKDMGPFTNIKFNPRMDEYLHPLWSVVWNYLSVPKLQRLRRSSLGM